MKKLLMGLSTCVFLASCAHTQSKQLYVLNDTAHNDHKKHLRPANLGVGPITLPKHLNKSKFIAFKDNKKQQRAQFDHWAKSLPDHLARIIDNNITTIAPKSHIYNYPWTTNANIDYQVKVDIHRLEVDHQDNAMVSAYWQIIDNNKSKTLIERNRMYKINTHHDHEPRHIVQLMSRNLLQMSSDIVMDLQQTH